MTKEEEMLMLCMIEREEDLWSADIPDKYHPENTRFLEKKSTSGGDDWSVDNYQMHLSGMVLSFLDIRCQSWVKFTIEIPGDVVLSYFSFSTAVGKKTASGKVGDVHNLVYLPAGNYTHELSGPIDISFLLVTFSVDYYLHLIHEESALHQNFAQYIQAGSLKHFRDPHLQVTPEIVQIIGSIKWNHREGELRRLYTQAKVLELLTVQLEQLNDPVMATMQLSAWKRSNRLEEIHDLLKTKLAHPPTHKELARMIGTNEQQLRRDFKAYYGMTLGAATLRLRMEHARTLLSTGRLSIPEVAKQVGFTHRSNFSHAFKRYFGEGPKNVK